MKAEKASCVQVASQGGEGAFAQAHWSLGYRDTIAQEEDDSMFPAVGTREALVCEEAPQLTEHCGVERASQAGFRARFPVSFSLWLEVLHPVSVARKETVPVPLETHVVGPVQ